jgi:hypothetical protein
MVVVEVVDLLVQPLPILRQEALDLARPLPKCFRGLFLEALVGMVLLVVLLVVAVLAAVVAAVKELILLGLAPQGREEFLVVAAVQETEPVGMPLAEMVV